MSVADPKDEETTEVPGQENSAEAAWWETAAPAAGTASVSQPTPEAAPWHNAISRMPAESTSPPRPTAASSVPGPPSMAPPPQPGWRAQPTAPPVVPPASPPATSPPIWQPTAAPPAAGATAPSAPPPGFLPPGNPPPGAPPSALPPLGPPIITTGTAISAKAVLAAVAVAAVMVAGTVALVTRGSRSGSMGIETGVKPADEQIELSKPEFVHEMCSEFKPLFRRYMNRLKKQMEGETPDMDPAKIARVGSDLMSFWVAVTADLNAKYRFSGADGRRASDGYPDAIEGARTSIELGRKELEEGIKQDAGEGSEAFGDFLGGLNELGDGSDKLSQKELEQGGQAMMLAFVMLGSIGVSLRGDEGIMKLDVGTLFIAYGMDKNAKSTQPSNDLNDLETYFDNEPACENMLEE